MPDPSEEELPEQWYIGVIIYVTGCLLNALGANLIKLSLNKEQAKPENERKPDCQRPLWLSGFCMYVSSGILLSIALNFATQAMLSPLMSIVLFSTVVFAYFLLGEKITGKDCLAILCIMIGVIMTTIGAPKENPSFNQEELIALYREPSFLAFILGWLILQALCYFAYFQLKPRVMPTITEYLETHHDIESNGTAKAKDSLNEKTEMKCCMETKIENEIDENPRKEDFALSKANTDYTEPKKRELRLFSLLFGIIAGLWGGLCVTLMKSTITIIVAEVTQYGFLSLLQSFLMYILIFLLAVTWLMQLKWLNTGLQYFPAMFVISVEAIFNEVTSVMGGLFYFQEIYNFKDKEALIFSLGLVMAVIGVGLIASRDNVELNECEEEIKKGNVEEISVTPISKDFKSFLSTGSTSIIIPDFVPSKSVLNK